MPQTGVLFQLIVDYGTAKKNIFCPTVGVWTFFTLYLRFHFYFGRDFFYFYVGFQPIVHQPQAPPFVSLVSSLLSYYKGKGEIIQRKKNQEIHHAKMLII